MKNKFCLWLTQQNVYDISNPASGGPKLTAWILNDKLLIVETLVGPKDLDLLAFTKDAIAWSNDRMKVLGGTVIAVGGDAANEAAIVGSGLQHTKISSLHDLGW